MLKRKKNFYEEYKEKCTLSKNIEFLEWLNKIIEKGYTPPINLDRMQELVDDIADNYPIVYINPKYKDKQVMGIFLKQLNMFECVYSTNSFIIVDSFDKKRKVKSYSKLKIKSLIPDDNKEFILKVDNETGIVEVDKELKKEISYKYSAKIKVENLYFYILQSSLKYKYDITELENCIFNHSCDNELRSEILKAAALKLLYNDRDNFKINYEITNSFIENLKSELDIHINIEKFDIFSKKNKKNKVKKLNKK